MDDAKEYIATRRAMEIVGINAEEQVHGAISQRQSLKDKNLINVYRHLSVMLFRMPYFVLWLQFSILETLSLQKGRKWTHQCLKMKSLGFI